MNFGNLSWFWRGKEQHYPLSHDLGFQRFPKIPDWGLVLESWFGFNHLSLIHHCSKVLIWGFGGYRKFLTEVWHLDYEFDKFWKLAWIFLAIFTSLRLVKAIMEQSTYKFRGSQSSPWSYSIGLSWGHVGGLGLIIRISSTQTEPINNNYDFTNLKVALLFMLDGGNSLPPPVWHPDACCRSLKLPPPKVATSFWVIWLRLDWQHHFLELAIDKLQTFATATAILW